MRKAEIYRNDILAGTLTETEGGAYVFAYDSMYFSDNTKPGISLTISKKQPVYSSEHLFPFFYNMLSEGSNRQVQSKQLKIDEKDFFGFLLATARYDTIGAITVRQITS